MVNEPNVGDAWCPVKKEWMPCGTCKELCPYKTGVAFVNKKSVPKNKPAPEPVQEKKGKEFSSEDLEKW